MLAELFPDRARPSTRRHVDLGPDGIASAVSRRRVRGRLQAYADDCHADSSCPVGPDAVAAIEELQAAVEEEPIPAQPRDLGPGELSIGLALPSTARTCGPTCPTRWPTLSTATARRW